MENRWPIEIDGLPNFFKWWIFPIGNCECHNQMVKQKPQDFLSLGKLSSGGGQDHGHNQRRLSRNQGWLVQHFDLEMMLIPNGFSMKMAFLQPYEINFDRHSSFSFLFWLVLCAYHRSHPPLFVFYSHRDTRTCMCIYGCIYVSVYTW
jgi:hypothetical protein